MNLPADPYTIRFIEQVAALQNYPMPPDKASSVEMYEQAKQWREEAYVCLARMIERGRRINTVAPSTKKATLGDLADGLSDLIDGVHSQFKEAAEYLELEEEEAA